MREIQAQIDSGKIPYTPGPHLTLGNYTVRDMARQEMVDGLIDGLFADVWRYEA